MAYGYLPWVRLNTVSTGYQLSAGKLRPLAFVAGGHHLPFTGIELFRLHNLTVVG